MSLTATRMHLEIVILSEVSQTEKDKYHMISLTYGILKNSTDELIYKTEAQMWKTNMIIGGKEGRDKLGDYD